MLHTNWGTENSRATTKEMSWQAEVDTSIIGVTQPYCALIESTLCSAGEMAVHWMAGSTLRYHASSNLLLHCYCSVSCDNPSSKASVKSLGSLAVVDIARYKRIPSSSSVASVCKNCNYLQMKNSNYSCHPCLCHAVAPIAVASKEVGPWVVSICVVATTCIKFEFTNDTNFWLIAGE